MPYSLPKVAEKRIRHCKGLQHELVEVKNPLELDLPAIQFGFPFYQQCVMCTSIFIDVYDITGDRLSPRQRHYPVNYREVPSGIPKAEHRVEYFKGRNDWKRFVATSSKVRSIQSAKKRGNRRVTSTAAG